MRFLILGLVLCEAKVFESKILRREIGVDGEVQNDTSFVDHRQSANSTVIQSQNATSLTDTKTLTDADMEALDTKIDTELLSDSNQGVDSETTVDADSETAHGAGRDTRVDASGMVADEHGDALINGDSESSGMESGSSELNSDVGKEHNGNYEVDKCSRAEEAEKACSDNHWEEEDFDEWSKESEPTKKITIPTIFKTCWCKNAWNGSSGFVGFSKCTDGTEGDASDVQAEKEDLNRKKRDCGCV